MCDFSDAYIVVKGIVTVSADERDREIYLHAKDLEEPKYQLLINKREQAGIKSLNDPAAFIEYSDSMDDILSNIEDLTVFEKVLIVFDDMISHVMSDKKAQQILKELFIRCRIKKWNTKRLQTYLATYLIKYLDLLLKNG